MLVLSLVSVQRFFFLLAWKMRQRGFQMTKPILFSASLKEAQECLQHIVRSEFTHDILRDDHEQTV